MTVPSYALKFFYVWERGPDEVETWPFDFLRESGTEKCIKMPSPAYLKVKPAIDQERDDWQRIWFVEQPSHLDPYRSRRKPPFPL